MGYSQNHKGYLCLAPCGKTYISRHVKFDELLFPFQSNSKFCVPPQSQSPSSMSIPHLSPSIPIVVPHNKSGIGPVAAAPTNATSPNIPLFENEQVYSPLIEDEQVRVETPHDPPTDNLGSVPDSEQAYSHGSPVPAQNSPQNAHPMVTRAKAGISKPKHIFLSQEESSLVEPRTVEATLKSAPWKSAMEAEFQALMHNNTWTLVPLPPGRTAIGYKWVFKLKKNADGSINKHKARFVAKGFNQQEGFNYFETFSQL